MLHTELKTYLKENQVRPAEFARFLGLTRHVVYLWTSGKSPIPQYVHVVLSLIPEEDVRYFVCGGLELIQFEPWQTLGVCKDATVGEAKVAYRRLALRSHSDIGGDEQVMKRINLAWEVFKDASRNENNQG